MATKKTERQLTIVIKAKDSFSATFTKASRLAKSTASVITKSFKVATIAVAGTSAAVFTMQGAIVALASSVATADDKIGKFAMRIGASTEALSEYQFVAELSGITAQTLGTAWQRQARRISQAAQGTGEAKKALEELNLSARDMNKLAPEDQFEMIADAMLNVSNQGDKMRIAMQIWDTEGVSLLQTMEGGAAGIRLMRDEAKLLGLSLSGEQAQQAAEYNDAMARLQFTFIGLKRTIIQEVLPELTQSFITIKDRITEFLPTIKTVVSTAITVILNFPASLKLMATAVSKIYGRITKESGESASQTVVLFTAAFQTLGPILGDLVINFASLIFKPLSAAFFATITNIKTKAGNIFKDLRLEGLKQALKDPLFEFNKEFQTATKSAIVRLEGELKESYLDIGEVAKEALIGQFDNFKIDFSGVNKGFSDLVAGFSSLWKDAKNDPALQELFEKIKALKKLIKDGTTPDEAPSVVTAATRQGPSTRSTIEIFAPELAFEDELREFFDRLESDQLKRDDFKRNMALGFFDFESDLVIKRMEIQRKAAALDIELSDEVAQNATINAFKRSSAQKAAAGITNAANKAMEDQLLSLVETGDFSAQAFADAVIRQTKAELIGISARAAVQALFQTGLGFAAAASGLPTSASLHFAAAGQFAAISGVALAGAAAVHQLGGNPTSPGGIAQTTPEITPEITPGTDAPISDPVGTQQGTIINIEINNPIGSEDWDKIAREEIIPAINRGGADNITIDSTVIRAV